MKRSILIIALVIVTVSKSIAQVHANSWLRSTISMPITGKFKVDLEGQLRRQNGFENENLLDKKLLYSLRTWCYYKQSEQVTFSLSPFAYFSNYKIIQNEADQTTPPTNEYRFSGSVELQHNVILKLFIHNRTAFEYRIFEGATENILRFRHRLGLRYDLSSTYNIGIGDEIFININGTDPQHLFDQNRFTANISFKPTPRVKFDLGYIYISRLLKNNIDLLEENNIFLNFTYTINRP